MPATTGDTPGTGGVGTSKGSSAGLSAAQAAVVSAQHTADVALETAAADLAAVRAACQMPPSGTTPPTGPAPTTSSTTSTTSTETSPTTSTVGSAPRRAAPGGTTPGNATPGSATPAGGDTPGAGAPGGSGGGSYGRFGGGGPSSTTTTTTTTVPGPGNSTNASPAPTAPGSPTSNGGGSDASGSACALALSTAATAEQAVSAGQETLATAENNLATALTAAMAAVRSASPTANPTGSIPSGTAAGRTTTLRPVTSGGSVSSAAGGSGVQAQTDTPAQLATDQASIDTDQASLVEAQQELAAATLTSPISGTVAAIGLSAGQPVAAGSTSATVTIVSSGSYETTASLSTQQVAGVKDGDSAQLTVDGINGTYSGRVTSVGPVDISGSSYTYPVVVALTSPTGQMAIGSATRITVFLDHASNVTAVPTSAVHTAGPGSSYVYLVERGREVTQKVAVGVVGPVYTQITSGLGVGERVVLADPSQAVPASSTNATIAGGVRAGGGVIRALLGGGAGRTGGSGGGLRGGG